LRSDHYNTHRAVGASAELLFLRLIQKEHSACEGDSVTK